MTRKLALVKTINRANLYTIGMFALNTRIANNECHRSTFLFVSITNYPGFAGVLPSQRGLLGG